MHTEGWSRCLSLEKNANCFLPINLQVQFSLITIDISLVFDLVNDSLLVFYIFLWTLEDKCPITTLV